MTGLYPIHTGLQHGVVQVNEDRGIPANITLLPEYLQRLGYKTHAIGKWHLGHSRKEYLPTFRGFDTHYGYWAGMQDYYSHSIYKVNEVIQFFHLKGLPVYQLIFLGLRNSLKKVCPLRKTHFKNCCRPGATISETILTWPLKLTARMRQTCLLFKLKKF